MERVILLVSVGNGPALAALADGLAAGRPDAAVRRVCSGGHGAALDAALARLRAEGIAWVDVQPLMLLPGHEYDRLRAALDSRRAEFARLRLGLPLLTGETVYYLKSYALLFCIGFVGATPLPARLGRRISETRLGSGLQWIFLAGVLLVCTAYLVDGSFSPFLYFRF